MHFYQVNPSLENYWRGIILFGRNVAFYKFALAKALYELRDAQSDLITLDDLALPFARHICEHLQQAPKQGTAKQSQFHNACNAFNRGELDQAALQAATVRLGFGAVIDAFHYVNNGEIEKRFFLDERRSHKGIRLTDNFFRLTESEQFANLLPETEARWRLVEQAWALKVSRSMTTVEYDYVVQMLFSRQGLRRTAITSCRDSLNGYQKGKCFYCYRSISIVSGDDVLAQIDHFLPWSLMSQGVLQNLDGVWNLVLASLLHVPVCELPGVMAILARALKPGSVCYLSFKLGSGEQEVDGRWFTDLDKSLIEKLLAELPQLSLASCWQTTDNRPVNATQWLNAIVFRQR